MKPKHVLLGFTPLSRFMHMVDDYMHRVNVTYLVNGYFPRYSLAVAVVLLVVSFTFWCPAERRLYGGFVPFMAQSFAVLMVASGVFCVSGGVFTRRQHQEKWILENVKDAAHTLVDITSRVRAVYTLLALEVVSEVSGVLSGSGCVCVILLAWMGWLIWRERDMLANMSRRPC